jgi:hypothetical protein
MLLVGGRLAELVLLALFMLILNLSISSTSNLIIIRRSVSSDELRSLR